MPRKPKRKRVPKDPTRLLQDCESHLRFLHEALVLYNAEPDRYKQLAGELRVLVCEAGQNKPLLLDLMDKYGVEYDVTPIPDLPFPIQMVDEPEAAPFDDFENLNPAEIWESHRQRARPVPLREFIKRALALFIRPHKHSYEDLILAVAQQIGASHEDRTVELTLLQLEQIIIGGFSGYGPALRNAAQHSLSAGVRLMQHVSDEHAYEATYFRLRQ